MKKKKRVPNTREETNKSKGGQLGHKKTKLERFDDNEITDTYVHEINDTTCSCGGKLLEIGKREKDEFEIDIRLKKIRHELWNMNVLAVTRKLMYQYQII